MKKFLFPVIVLINLFCYGQKGIPHWQPENIDQLKRQLPYAIDTAGVNLLNELSFAYFNIQMDSSRYYALRAKEQATRLKYIPGISTALLYLSQWELLMDNPAGARDYAQQALLNSNGDNSKEYAMALLILGILSPKDEGMPLLEKSDSVYRLFHDTPGELDILSAKAILFLRTGQTFKALEVYKKYAQIGDQSGDVETHANALLLIGRIYAIIGDYALSNAYLWQSISYRVSHQHSLITEYNEIYDNDMQLKKYDSALCMINRYIVNTERVIRDSTIKKKLMTTAMIKKGEVYSKLGYYDSALSILNPILKETRNNRQISERGWLTGIIGHAYELKKDHHKALSYGYELMDNAVAGGETENKKNAAGILSEAYQGLNKADSAFHYLKIFTIFNDSLEAKDLRNNMTFFKTVSLREAAETKIELLKKDNQIKQQKLNILIASLVVVFLISGIIFRYLSLRRKNDANRRALMENQLQIQKLEGEKKQAYLQQYAAEMEMHALRAQMNPHFIFNCLNAINHFILNNETQEASDYLTKFSRLIRMVLQNTPQGTISLEDELIALRLYIELEQFRFHKRFQFSISIDKNIDTEALRIPPLLLQPFVENAIWHGLMHKESEGRLQIEVNEKNNMLICVITDNGIGRESSSVNKILGSGKKSMGMQITSDRLRLLEGKQTGGSFTIVDLKDANHQAAGTKVIVRVPLVEQT